MTSFHVKWLLCENWFCSAVPFFISILWEFYWILACVKGSRSRWIYLYHMISILLCTVGWLIPRASSQWAVDLCCVFWHQNSCWTVWKQEKPREGKSETRKRRKRKRQALVIEERAHNTFEIIRLVLGQLVLNSSLQSSNHP